MNVNMRRLALAALAAVVVPGCTGLGGTAAKAIVAVVTAEISEEVLREDDNPPASPAKPAAPARPAAKTWEEVREERRQAQLQEWLSKLQARFAKCRESISGDDLDRAARSSSLVWLSSKSPECGLFERMLRKREQFQEWLPTLQAMLQARFAEGDAPRFAKCMTTSKARMYGRLTLTDLLHVSTECRVFAEKLLKREERERNGPFSDGDVARWGECMDEQASQNTRQAVR